MGFTAWVLHENSAEKHSGGTDEVLRIKPNDRTGTENKGSDGHEHMGG